MPLSVSCKWAVQNGSTIVQTVELSVSAVNEKKTQKTNWQGSFYNTTAYAPVVEVPSAGILSFVMYRGGRTGKITGNGFSGKATEQQGNSVLYEVQFEQAGTYTLGNAASYTFGHYELYVQLKSWEPIETAGDHRTLISGTKYAVTNGSLLLNGASYVVKQGSALVDGTAYEIKL